MPVLGLLEKLIDFAKWYLDHKTRGQQIRVTPIPMMWDDGNGEPSETPMFLLSGVYAQNRQLIAEPIRNVGYLVGKERCWFGARVLVGPNLFSLPLPIAVEPHSAQAFYPDGSNPELNRCLAKLKKHLSGKLWFRPVRVAVRTETGDIYESKKFSRKQVRALRDGLLASETDIAPQPRRAGAF